MMPMMIKALPVLGALPRNMPDVTWIPSDVCAAALAEFATRPMAEGDEDTPRVKSANHLVAHCCRSTSQGTTAEQRRARLRARIC